MTQNILEIENLSVSINNKEIIKELNLSIKSGEIHAIMGPNGSGKSTLAKVIAGHPLYKITEGSIFLKQQNITNSNPEERAHAGLFLGFQYPVEIPGVNNLDFLRLAYNQKQKIKKKEKKKMNLSGKKQKVKYQNLIEIFALVVVSRIPFIYDKIILEYIYI